jgi:very-short-patch-repair endonuclease
MARQRDLERCGWRFPRLRASEFYRDPEATLELLWKQLQERGIWPVRA